MTALGLVAAEAAHQGIGDQLNLLTVLPFAGMLLAIAILPLVTPHWFEHLRNKGIVAAIFGVPVIAYLLVTFGADGLTEILHTGEEYISFIMYVAALFTVAGGIYISGDTMGSPKNNTIFLIVGAILANFIGTTGAAMLLIRPLLRANAGRKHKMHIFIFLIFTVCNTAGLLTPLGDPPLFLGFIRGVDFFWTLGLWKEWLVVQAILMALFFVVDTLYYRREEAGVKAAPSGRREPLRIRGAINIIFLIGVVLSVYLSGSIPGFEWWMRDLVLVGIILLSVFVAPREPRQRNQFSWAPIGEVAIVFAGIFASMIPALAILRARGDQLGLDQPWQFFWLTGALSSFLDNAPTYLVFGSMAQGMFGLEGFGELMGTNVNPAVGHAPAAFLAAISCGAVFMGANSYIGNAPNFMVKAICEEQGIKMPSFFGYVGLAALVLLPVFAVVTVLFFI